MLFYKEGSLPVNKKSEEKVFFVIARGENLNSVINNLAKVDLIRNRLVFYIIVKQLGIEKKIQAGDYRLSKSMNAYELANSLTHGSIDIWVTVPEGLRKEEIAEIMAKKLDISKEEFVKIAPEGYLFPDTYLIPKSPTEKQIVNIMKANFDSKYTPKITRLATANGLTDRETLILASIVEKEAKFDEDRLPVASVLLRRYREKYPLEVDATVQYALGYQTNENRWWKSFLTYSDLEINSSYNTYKRVGLPPTPISNPGIASILAVSEANQNTPYMYYLAEPSGKTHYARTFEEHQANIQKYLR